MVKRSGKGNKISKKILLGALAASLIISGLSGIVSVQKAEAAQTVWNFGYSGDAQSFTAPYTGKYQLEVWGAQGNADSGDPGEGGYAKGEINLAAGQVIYVYVGGRGSRFNGGGYSSHSWTMNGSGGTDIRIRSDGNWKNNLDSRIIVAGAGGSAEWAYGIGGAGGGAIGGSGNVSSGTVPQGGTQSSGGSGYYAGGFGYGGYTDASIDLGGPGGGGWYGGGSGNSTGGGGGGSSYIGGVTNGSTISGSATMPAPGGGTELGHSGHGYARITSLGDFDPPTATHSLSTTAWTNTNVTITVNGYDPSGISQIQKPDGSWVNGSSASYTVGQNGNYNFIVKDSFGNQITYTVPVTNIDKTFSNGSISSPASGSWTNTTSYKVRVTGVTDAESGVNRVQFPTWTESGGQDDLAPDWQNNRAVTGVNLGNGTWEFTVNLSEHNNENGKYITHPYVVDNAGNIRNIGEVIVNVDRTAPSIGAVSDKQYTNKNSARVWANNVVDTESGISYVSVYAVRPDGSYYLLGNATKDGTTNNYYYDVTDIILDGNWRYDFRAYDNAGNVVGPVGTNVLRDTQAPAKATLSADVTKLTNGNVIVSIVYPSDVSVKQYKIDSEEWKTYTSSITMTSNGTVYARSQDAVGNWSAENSLVVNNIDKTPPGVATITPSTTSPTNKDVLISISYPTDAEVKQYKIGNGAWQPYSNAISINENVFVCARSQDAAGNWSEEVSYEVNNIDKIAPEKPLITIDNKLLKITPANQTDTKVIKYRVNDGEWLTYSEELLLEAGVYTIEAKSVDEAGNESDVSSLSFEIVDYSKATKAVEEAEATPSQDKVDFAQNLINQLPTSNEKLELQERLDEVQKNVDLYASIQRDIDQITTNLVKTNTTLQQVEQYKNRVNELRNEVNKLPNTMDKNHLNTQLDALYKKLLLIETVLKTNSNGDLEDVDLGGIQDGIDELPDGDLKDQLQEELDKAKELADNIKDATDKVERAEGSVSQDNVDVARDAVKKLPNGQIKDDLNHRLDDVQNRIPIKDIDNVKDPNVKPTLIDAERYVELAEKYKTKTWIVTALEKVSAIPDQVKTNPLYSVIVNDLTNRANKLKSDYNSGIADQELEQKIAVATNYVTQYEKYKSVYYKSKAQTTVNELPDNEVKTALQARIDAVIPK